MNIRNVVPRRRRESNEVQVQPSGEPHFQLQDHVNRIFDDFFRGFGLTPASSRTEGDFEFAPKVDVVDSERSVRVEVELPGVDEKDVDVSLSDDALSIRGEKKAELQEERDGWYRTERSFGSFHRVIPLPCEIDADAVRARFKNGVLTVELPKSESAREQTRKIRVRGE